MSFVDRKKTWLEKLFWAGSAHLIQGNTSHVYFTGLLLSNLFPPVLHSQESHLGLSEFEEQRKKLCFKELSLSLQAV